MIRGAQEEQMYQADQGRTLDRRRAVVVSTKLALGVVASAGGLDGTDAAKKRKKPKKGKKRKSQDATGAGRDVVKVAMKYKGSRYTWGGASPKGFDCSGFTWYVYQKATGMDITRGVEEQWRMGHSVSRGKWEAGDLVFFENTFKRGLSHTGIYIGGNEFIHAENEETGVVISALDSDYYSAHYAGARRLL